MLSSLANAAGLSRPKKKFHFDVSFRLEELLHCTYVAGLIFSKIRLRDGGTFSEISNRCDVQTHIVQWNQQFDFHCKMYGSPVTGELEPCLCKVSIRKETKGGRSYKKLGFVKINLAEFAGAGVTQRKYLLDSYNENKHKPDNSILKVTISLRLTSGDSLFKVPCGAGYMWELGEAPEDEGIQPDIHVHSVKPHLSYSSSTHISATSSSALSFYPNLAGCSSVSAADAGVSGVTVCADASDTGGGDGSATRVDKGDGGATGIGGGDGGATGGSDCATGVGGGDGDATGVDGGDSGATEVRGGDGGATGLGGGEDGETGISGGVVSVHGDHVRGGGSEKSGGSGGGSLQDIRWHLGGDVITRKTNSACNLRGQSIYDLSVVEEASPLATHTSTAYHIHHTHSRTLPLTHKVNRAGSLDEPEEHAQIHSTIGNSKFGLPPLGGVMTHRRLASWSQASNGNSPTSMHRRQQSLVSGQSSKSTSAYSTLSERSTAGSMEGGGEVDSMCGSLRGRPTMAGSTSSRVEQSRVNPQAVIDNLFSSQNFSHNETELEVDQGGLKIYVDKSRGTITLAGPNLDRRNTNLQAIDVDKHKTSPKRRHRKGSHQAKERQAPSRETSPCEISPPSSPPLPHFHSPHVTRASTAEEDKGKLGPTRLLERATSASSSDSTRTLTPGK